MKNSALVKNYPQKFMLVAATTGVLYVSCPVNIYGCGGGLQSTDVVHKQCHNCWKFTVITLYAQLMRHLLAIAKLLVLK